MKEGTKLKEAFKEFRYGLAQIIASDLIEDLETRLSTLLCHVTGSKLSKSYYSADTMIRAADDHQTELCDECEERIECENLKQLLDAAITGQETLQKYFATKDTTDGFKLRYNEETKQWEKYAPYVTIDCMTKEDFDFIVEAVKKAKEANND